MPATGQTSSAESGSDLPATLRAATAELVAERGVSGFSLREVARRAGVSHAAPGHHFGSSRGLLTAVAVEGFEVLARALEVANSSHSDPRERLRAGGRAYVDLAVRYPGHHAVMLASDVHDVDDEALFVAGCEAFERLLECVCAIRDDLNSSLDVETASVMVWSTMVGLVALSSTLPDVQEKNELADHPIDVLVDRMTDLFIDGFGG